MTGVVSAIERARRERRELDEAHLTALGALAARVRELAEAVVLTDVEIDELAEVGAQVEALTARLGAVRREAPPVARYGGKGPLRNVTNPVTGPGNPLAPPIEVEFTEAGARAEFVLNHVHEGPPSFVHGGIAAMILDQVLGMAAASKSIPGVTASLELKYRRPTPIGVPLVVEAEVTGTSGRRSHAAGRILNPAGLPTVEATALFITPQR
ncbi:PaaI family thioesterase [Actinomadura rupiterrae]|uniref:PaaI family thioesterase n=1 Tax=Actinomadura rupiterrae TaxID=559627 RepID=UPI0020A5E7E3|nr:PaaI family thioesterase [Actinomadura rupiterrae]MCP2339640.1 acyl-coenzyme A thioesterase PaaI-like protein [Actinomadura rupiterrae]